MTHIIWSIVELQTYLIKIRSNAETISFAIWSISFSLILRFLLAFGYPWNGFKIIFDWSRSIWNPDFQPIRDLNLGPGLNRVPSHFVQTLNGNHSWKHQNTSVDQNRIFLKFLLFQILLFDERNIQNLIRIEMEYFWQLWSVLHLVSLKKCYKTGPVTVMLVTSLCWWLNDGDWFQMLVADSLCERLFFVMLVIFSVY